MPKLNKSEKEAACKVLRRAFVRRRSDIYQKLDAERRTFPTLQEAFQECPESLRPIPAKELKALVLKAAANGKHQVPLHQLLKFSAQTERAMALNQHRFEELESAVKGFEKEYEGVSNFINMGALSDPDEISSKGLELANKWLGPLEGLLRLLRK